MHEMVKGANVGLSALSEDVGSAMVRLSWSSPTGEGDADVSVLLLTADGKLRTSIEIAAPEQGYPLTWSKRLVRQLSDAPADLHVEALLAGQAPGPRGTLERLRPEPADLLPKDGTPITGFRLSLFRGMGNTRGNAESGFIRSVDESVDRFHAHVVVHLDRRTSSSRTRETVPAG